MECGLELTHSVNVCSIVGDMYMWIQKYELMHLVLVIIQASILYGPMYTHTTYYCTYAYASIPTQCIVEGYKQCLIPHQ